MNKTPLDVINELDIAFNNGDLDSVLSFYEDNATVVIEPEKTITGKASLREFFAGVIQLNGKATQQKTHVIESGNLALFTSKWLFEWKLLQGDVMQRQSFATTVLRKNEHGEWLIAIDNSFGHTVLS